jgi:hypothetical protein
MSLNRLSALLGEGFSVAFDPLDGSSVVDTNFSVGTIFGVWPGEKLTGITGRDQVPPLSQPWGKALSHVLDIKGSATSEAVLPSLHYCIWTAAWAVPSESDRVRNQSESAESQEEGMYWATSLVQLDIVEIFTAY